MKCQSSQLVPIFLIKNLPTRKYMAQNQSTATGPVGIRLKVKMKIAPKTNYWVNSVWCKISHRHLQHEIKNRNANQLFIKNCMVQINQEPQGLLQNQFGQLIESCFQDYGTWWNSEEIRLKLNQDKHFQWLIVFSNKA